MIKIELIKGVKDHADKVFVKEDNDEKRLLTFDVIKEYSMALLDMIKERQDYDYEIIINDNSLLLYKETLDKILKSIVEDKELQEIYKETCDKNTGALEQPSIND